MLSALGRQHRDEDGKFTFALIYDEIKGYNIWQQSNNPIHEIDAGGRNYFVSGYNPIDIKANRSDPLCTFGGLVNPRFQNVLLHGCPGGTNWYFAIGYNGKTTNYPKIPSNETNVNIVSLWVKILVFKDIFSCLCNYASFFSSRLLIYPFISMELY